MNGFELPPAFVLLEACCLRLSVALLQRLPLVTNGFPRYSSPNRVITNDPERQ